MLRGHLFSWCEKYNSVIRITVCVLCQCYPAVYLMKITRKSPHFNGEIDRAYLISVINPFTCLTHAIFLIETTLSFGCANNLTYKP